MLKINSIIDDVLGGVPDVYPLNVLKPLGFMLEQEEHNAKFQEILDLKHPEVALVTFKQTVEDEVERLELLRESNTYVESFKPLGGKNLKPFKYLHRVWGLVTIYYAYDFAHKKYEEIADVYDSRIGDMVLDGIESIILMKQKEEMMDVDAHDYKFYEETEKARSRAIEFLVAGSKQESAYFNDLYLDSSKDDLLQNFFDVLHTQPLEAECLYVAETKAGNVMQYRNEAEGVSFQTKTFRLLRTANSLGGFGVGMRKVAQLQNLDKPNHYTKYSSVIKINVGSIGASSEQMIKPVVEELESDLIEQWKPLPRVCREEELELKAGTKPIRRDDGLALNQTDDKDPIDAHIPSPYMESRRNRAMSSKIVKNGLHLSSHYSVVPLEILSDFLSSLPMGTKEEKLSAILILITLVMGCQVADTIGMLLMCEDSVFTYEDGTITVKIDKSHFAANSSKEFLQKSDDEISFEIPYLLSLLIAEAKRTLAVTSDTEDVDIDMLKDNLKEYSEFAKKSFPKEISFEVDKLYRHLKSYIKVTNGDLVTSFFATATYHKNDTPKMSYTSTNTKSQAHSQLLLSYWLELGLDSVVRSILGLGSEVFTTKPISIKEPKYAGSSRCAQPDKAKEFNRILDENIRSYSLSEDDDVLFALASIKIGYAMSFLSGTRNFNNSTDFSSYSHYLGTVTISEKASTVAAGLRVIPLCDVINDGLKSYNDIFLKPRGLNRRVCFLDAGKVVPFTQRSALKTLKNIPNLSKRAVLEEYVQNVPLNTGRHCFAKKATELSISSEYISAYLGHNFSGSEQFGIYSTLDTKKYYEQARYVESSIAIEFGIGGLSW
ncbi:MAG: hypothetical protein DRQ78_09550 [Epsilonproteobacteria bacterium]|nr:MAG: hypothetical protein DRQ78_09550 [Campylobacterota bacterium]